MSRAFFFFSHLEISVEEAQNLMGQILDECVESVEKCWWGNGEEKPSHPNLITLAEKLGFNVEKFSKITGSTNSQGDHDRLIYCIMKSMKLGTTHDYSVGVRSLKGWKKRRSPIRNY